MGNSVDTQAVADSTIEFNPDGMLIVKINVKAKQHPDNIEINAYGTLHKAHMMIFQYFAMEELRRRQTNPSLIHPAAVRPTPLNVA